ncbi:hypothetical protein GCM10011581_46720 [Saccharopolyspora subtropica]|uniref:AB hydrolase-1 domain-containing protein n=1 Tax=Saccharopolyspora thermophila TaxID=89367 RepID=A0A917NIS7_9PSEU|nr:hypothetical protein GCM10011581_46720 [Saccharopolyspora subtropica]
MEPARLGLVGLSDGRKLAWAEWGPAGGSPVLLCPGAATSRWLGFGADVVDRLGIRLISLDRPGLGASDPAPGRTLDDWARDVAELGLPDLAVIGYSAGGPFALASPWGARSGVLTRRPPPRRTEETTVGSAARAAAVRDAVSPARRG